MNVSLTPELNQFVTSKLESGLYTSASEVVREALRLLEERDRMRSAQIDSFNRELGTRLESLDQGKIVEPRKAQEAMRARSQERRRSRS
jgi:antitoxin ParD1/3/4